MANLFSRSLLLLAIAFAISVSSGCSSLQSLGLPFGSPQHRLLRTTRTMANSQTSAAPIPKELDKGVLAEYRVEPGDTLAIEGENFEDSFQLPGDQTVTPDGYISLGQHGRIQVAGLNLNEIEKRIAAKIAAESDTESKTRIHVRIVNWESKVFYVLGEVNSPGAYPISGRETVLDALVAAGELTRSANRQKIILARPSLPEECRIVLPVCYRHIVQLGDTSTNYQLQPGDRIYVPSMGMFDDAVQTLFPRRAETCPRCSSCQQGCDTGQVQSQLLPTSTMSGEFGSK